MTEDSLPLAPLSLGRRKEVRALHRKRERRKRTRLLVEGPVVLRAVLALAAEAPRPGGAPGLVLHYAVLDEEALARDRAVAEVAAQLAQREVPLHLLPADEFAELAATQGPQGLLAVASLAAPPPLQEWLRSDRASAANESTPAELRNRCRLLLLDAVQDPGNVGTLLRSAAALGVGGVVLMRGTAEPTNPKVVRASAGAFAALPVWSGLEPAEALAAAHEAELALLLADVDGTPYREVELPRETALVLGAEVAGLSAAARQTPAALTLRVPQVPEPQSLNVAMAGTILLAHLGHG